MITEKQIEPLKKALSLIGVTIDYVNNVSYITSLGTYKPSEKLMIMRRLIDEARDECFKESPDYNHLDKLINDIAEIKGT